MVAERLPLGKLQQREMATGKGSALSLTASHKNLPVANPLLTLMNTLGIFQQ